MMLIKADALKKKYCDCCAVGTDCMGSRCKIYEARCLIAELPKIEAEPVRHGRWIDNGEDKFICSACKGYVYRWFGKSDFCPRCSADMREEGADNG